LVRRSTKRLDGVAQLPRRLLVAAIDGTRVPSLEGLELPSSPGDTKSKIDQISLRRFSIGVPVSARRRSLLSAWRRAPWPLSGFLMCCASSRIT
jgi:hypothetical protein